VTITHFRPADTYVINEVLRDGVYKGLELGADDVLLDLGAHVGSCVEYALRAGVTQVVAVEMLPETLSLLRRNFGNDPRVTIIGAAVANEDRGATVTTRRWRNPMGAGISEFTAATGKGSGIVVPTVHLPGLLRGYEPTKLKFDIEYAEYEAVLPYLEEINASQVTRMTGELHTGKPEALKMAKEMHEELLHTGWQSNKRLDQFPAEPSGWNVHPFYWR
jgi:FkbM family methyltransferase